MREIILDLSRSIFLFDNSRQIVSFGNFYALALHFKVWNVRERKKVQQNEVLGMGTEVN